MPQKLSNFLLILDKISELVYHLKYMSGIEREITLETRISLIEKHIPGTSQAQKVLETEGMAYLFNDRETMENVAQSIKKQGELTGEFDTEDNYERYGLYFNEPIGYIIKSDGTSIPLYYGEIKIKKTTGKYHVIPRTCPRRTNQNDNFRASSRN